MQASQETTGIAVLCDTEGMVLKVLRDDLGIGEHVACDQPWSALMDRGSLKKALNFLVELRDKGAAFDWEMNVPGQDGPMTLHFVGVELDSCLLVIGATSSDDVMELYEDMMRINNQQANALRRAAKDRSERTQTEGETDSKIYDEITRLNNELIAMQRELARKNAELERLNEQKNELLGMAAHDLRNPLQSILSYSLFLLEDLSDELSEEHVEFLSIIQASTEFMATLVNDLLDVAKIESGKLQLDVEPTDLAPLVEQNAALNRPIARSKDIALRVSVDEVPPMALDAPKIQQVLNNLISNAIKYSPSDTAVDVRLHRSKGEVVLSVEDQGQGIPEDEIDALFEPFATTSVRGTAGEKSTGLGLVITKRIVEGHGGQIQVESDVGEGTVFVVTLPIEGNGRKQAPPL